MRRRDVLAPGAAADLAALDAALAGATGADPQLVALADGVRTAAPRPTPAFRARLDQRVAAGFPPEGPTTPRTAPAARRRPRAWRSALAPVAALLAALLVAGGLGLRARSGGGGADAPRSAVSRSASGGGGEAAGGPAGASAAPTAAPPPAGGAALAPGRRVERSTRLELGTTSGRFGSVTDGVVRA